MWFSLFFLDILKQQFNIFTILVHFSFFHITPSVSPSHLDLFAIFPWFKHQGPFSKFIVSPGICRAIFSTVIHKERVLSGATFKDHPEAQISTVLCALILSTFKANVGARGQVTIMASSCAPRVVRRMFPQYVASAYHHACCLDAVEGSALFLLNEGRVVGHFN